MLMTMGAFIWLVMHLLAPDGVTLISVFVEYRVHSIYFYETLASDVELEGGHDCFVISQFFN